MSNPRKPVRPRWQDPPMIPALDLAELTGKKKTFWRERRSHTWCFFCPLCRSQRRLPFRPKPGGLRHYAQVGLTACFFTLLTWKWFTWKGLVSFVPFWIGFETIYRSQVRKHLHCPHCGFDPFLYLLDLKSAREEIESHWRKKFAEKGIPYPEKSADPGVSPESALQQQAESLSP